MFLLNFLPDIVFHIILLVGIAGIVAGLVLKGIPFVSKYNVPILLLGIFLTIAGVWYEGGIAKDRQYREEILAMQVKIAESEKLAADANAKIEYVFVDKIKTVKDVQVVIQERIRDVSVKLDENCKISTDLIDIHNRAARNQK